jgi:RNA-directed DNA polymerase
LLQAQGRGGSGVDAADHEAVAADGERGENAHLSRAEALVENLNRMLRGWANYFKLGRVSNAYRLVDYYTTGRPRRWLCHKHKVESGGYCLYPDDYLYGTLGLVRLPALTRNLPWAKA